MSSFFGPEFFKNNRHKLRELSSADAPIVITANGLLQRNGDSAYPFRQDSSFWYLTGIELPDTTLVIDKSKEYIILPRISPNEKIFGSDIDQPELSDISGIKVIYSADEGWQRLSELLKSVKQVATLGVNTPYSDHFGFYVNPARSALIAKLGEINKNLILDDLRPQLSHLRMRKQPQELESIRKAIGITINTLQTVSSRLKDYKFEYEVEADITQGFRSRGARGHAFEPIVASGKNTTTLHYQKNNQIMKELVVLDVGAEYELYAADITRTYALAKPSKRLEAVHQAVKDVQSFALEHLRPGAMIKDNEKLIETFIGEKLRGLGLIKSVNKESVRKYYPHSTSHFLGLDVHDVGDYNQPLEAGMVLTVEPGIYIPEEGIGVRIEEDVLITKTGAEVLSKNLPSIL